MEFKDRIKEIRNEKNVSAVDLARLLNKSESAIRMWESGKTKPDADTLIELAKYFNCTTDYLLGLSDVRSTNLEVKEMSKKLGLSEMVIYYLTNYQTRLTIGNAKVNINNKDYHFKKAISFQKCKPPKDMSIIISSSFFIRLVETLWILKNIKSDKLPESMQKMRGILSTVEYRKFVINNIKNDLDNFLNELIPFEATTQDEIRYDNIDFYEDISELIAMDEGSQIKGE